MAKHERVCSVKYKPDLTQETCKKRVAAYARVSSDKEDALHSLSAQISYYNNLISSHTDWELVEIFADEGKTGTKDNRPEFQRMLATCREGKIDIILAKSITRFARNTVTLLDTIRELKHLGVDVHFEEENLHTLSAKGEFLISVFAAHAQEQSRSASENQKWRIRKKFEKGEPINGNALGYRLVDGTFWVDEEEEWIVKYIFDLYLSGMGKVAIAKKLNEEGVPTRLNKSKWYPESVAFILRNEKYCGDLRLQKYFVTDHLTKKQKRNKGERPSYLTQNTHDAIIDRETFECVQHEIAHRAENALNGKKIGYPFTGLLRCGKCGNHYTRKIGNSSTPYAHPIWLCNASNVFGQHHCNAKLIPEDILTAKTCEVLGLKELDRGILRDKVTEIVVPEKYVLIYRFKDGSEQRVEWKHRSRRESWTPEMKERARQRTKKRLEEEKKC